MQHNLTKLDTSPITSPPWSTTAARAWATARRWMPPGTSVADTPHAAATAAALAGRAARALGMHVVSSTRRPSPEREAETGVRFVRFPELLRMSEVVVLCCAVTDETRGLIGADALRRMKPSAYLVNAARGALVGEAALAEALHSGKVKGDALDVLSKEAPGGGHPLFALDNVVITRRTGSCWSRRSSPGWTAPGLVGCVDHETLLLQSH